ncbi:MAG: nucleotide-binding protein [Candidatus Omnitrophica bacterium]|nr:nucleotide-binding protein [Candidatus Omnitrophota bacterium]
MPEENKDISEEQTPPEEDLQEKSAEPAADSPESSQELTPLLEDFKLTQKKVFNKVFFLHGLHEKMRKKCLQLLEKSNIEPLVIYQNPDISESIEKIINENPQIPFAVVLLSGDEFVFAKDRGSPADAKLRSTQHIVFDAGFLCGRLGRENVFILYHEQKNFLLPTGLSSAIYIPYDKYHHWEDILINRLKNCGYSINSEKSEDENVMD